MALLAKKNVDNFFLQTKVFVAFLFKKLCLLYNRNTNNILLRSADRANLGATPKACRLTCFTFKDKQLVFILLHRMYHVLLSKAGASQCK